jgi:LPXTG-motif cell wall-anchored protein
MAPAVADADTVVVIRPAWRFFTVSFRRRLVALAAGSILVTALAAAPSSAQPASASVVGLGNATGGGSVISVDLGGLLSLRLLGEDSAASIDPADGTPSALERLAPVTLASTALPDLGQVSVAPVQTYSTGDEDRKDTAILDLSSLGVPIAGLLNGDINPASLSSLVNLDGARSSLTTSLADLNILGGLLNLDSVTGLFGGLAHASSSDSARQIGVDGVSVLSIDGLLQLLGLSLGDLPLDTVLTLVNQLGVLGPLGDLTGLDLNSLSDLTTVVDGLGATISQLTTQITDLLPLETTCTGVEPILLLLGISCVDVATTVTTLQITVDNTIQQLTDVLDGVVSILDSTALVALDGIRTGVVAQATDTVDGSSATAGGSIADLRIGAFDLGGVSLDSTLDQINSLVNSAEAQLNAVLGVISPALSGIVDIELFDRNTAVGAEGGKINALADLTALRLTITPPDLCALLGPIVPTGSLGETLNSLDATLPATPVTDILDALGAVVNCPTPGAAVVGAEPAALVQGVATALSQPVVLAVASSNSGASFTPAAPAATTTTTTPVGGGNLPQTGGNQYLLLMVGALLGAGALGGRGLARRRRFLA